MNYLVADFITRIKNAAAANRKDAIVPFSNLNQEIGKALMRIQYLTDIQEEEIDGKKYLKAKITYSNRMPLVQGVTIISKPSLRVYKKAKDMPKRQTPGAKIAIVSTSQGVLTGKEANEKGLGGELLFEIW